MIIIIPNTNINKERCTALEYICMIPVFVHIYGDDGKWLADTKRTAQQGRHVHTILDQRFIKYNMKLLAMGCCDEIFTGTFSLSREIL